MNHRTRVTVPSRPALALSALLGALALVASTAHAGDSVRMSLLASAGSSQVVKVDYRKGHYGSRDHRGRGHRGAGHRGPGYGGYGRDPGHFIHERAHRYATTAVNQALEARSLGHYSDHPRWRAGYDRHYRWALEARPHRIDEEIRRRAHKLRELRTYGYGFPPRANHRHGPHCRH